MEFQKVEIHLYGETVRVLSIAFSFIRYATIIAAIPTIPTLLILFLVFFDSFPKSYFDSNNALSVALLVVALVSLYTVTIVT